MDYRVLFVLVLIFFSCLPVNAEINPSVESQPFFCRYSLTDWTPLCVQGGTGTGTTPINAENNTYFYNSTSNETYIFSNETSLFNITIGNNLTTISNYTYFTLVNITYSEMNQTPGPQGPQGVNGTPGIDGYTPVFGVDYFNGSDGAPGYTPIFGVDYFNGSDGAPGPQGEKGDKGDKGDTGDTGPMNMTPNMTAGPQGIQGIQGIQGVNGTPGYNGVNGLDANVSTMWPVSSVYAAVVSTNPATLLGAGTWSQLYTTGGEITYRNISPTQSSNTAPAGNTTLASSEYSASYAAWKSSDGTNGAGNRWSASTGGTQWWQTNLSASYVVRNYTIYPDVDGLNDNPTTWKINASSDGTTWTTINTQTGITWPTSAVKSFPFTNSDSYSYYRIVITATGGGTPSFSEIKFYDIGSQADTVYWWKRTA